MSDEDRRVFPRFACRFPAAADGPRGPIRGTCTDLSMGGLFLEGVTLGANALTQVTIDFPTGKAVFQAQVRRVSMAPKGIGLQFTRLETQQLAVLQKYSNRG
jgi:hypothetical protein